jgi:hypothetical protein
VRQLAPRQHRQRAHRRRGHAAVAGAVAVGAAEHEHAVGAQVERVRERPGGVGCPCPLLAPDRPDVVCTLACGVVEGALGASGGGLRVARHDNDPRRRACTIHLTRA